MSDPIDIEQVLEKILGQSDTLVKSFVPGHNASLADAKGFLASAKADLAVYFSMFASQEIDEELLRTLIRGEVDNAVLHKIKETELEAVQMDKLKAELTSLIVTAISSSVEIGKRATV